MASLMKFLILFLLLANAGAGIARADGWEPTRPSKRVSFVSVILQLLLGIGVWIYL